MSVRIFKMQQAFDWWTHLCAACLKTWLGRGWHVREEKDPPHELVCDECGAGVFGAPLPGLNDATTPTN